MNSIQACSSVKTLRNRPTGPFHGCMDKANWDSETPLFTEECAAGGATLAIGLGVVVTLLLLVFLVP